MCEMGYGRQEGCLCTRRIREVLCRERGDIQSPLEDGIVRLPTRGGEDCVVDHLQALHGMYAGGVIESIRLL